MMSFAPRKTKSGLPENFWFLRQPVILPARKIEINLSSVDLFPRDLTVAMIFDRYSLENVSVIPSRG